jgi:uncharacterized membrane protein YdbT with pleckstrin-like domain
MKKYPSAVDSWIVAALAAAPIVVIALGIAAMRVSLAAGVFQIGFGVGIIALIVALSVPCVYTLTDTTLHIRCGIFKEEIPLSRIRGAEKSGSLWSAPALSIKRVKVRLDHGFRLISPKDRDGFIAEINARCGAGVRPS